MKLPINLQLFADENKIKYGLKNVHYSVITETDGAITYGTPKPIPGAVNLTLNASGEKVTFYADDVAYFEEEVNDGYEGTLEMALIPDEFRVDVLGDYLDANDVLVENVNGKPNRIALMFEFDGDKKKTRHILYNVTVGRPNVEGTTKTTTKEPKTEVMNISAKPSLDTGDVKATIKQGQTGYDTLFETVYIPQPVTPPSGD